MVDIPIRALPEPSLETPSLPADGYAWHRALALEELPEGRVKTVSIGRRSLAMTHFRGGYGALDNRCPHQGGPLGEGSIEKGWLRCPWHGYDYSPCNGAPPPGFSDAPAGYATEVRADGVYVALPPDEVRARTVSDVMVETMVNWGVTHVFGMVGHSNLGLADAFRAAEERGDLRFVGIRHEGAASFAAGAYGKLTGGLAACFGIAGPGSTNLLTGPLRRQGRPGARAGAVRAGPVQGDRPRRVPGRRPERRVRRRGPDHPLRPRQFRPRRAGQPGLQDRTARARRHPPGVSR